VVAAAAAGRLEISIFKAKTQPPPPPEGVFFDPSPNTGKELRVKGEEVRD
jgi:hypothetical protein